MKTVLVTGCSSGIGRATALEFRRREWTVYATARDPDDLTALEDAGCETDRLDVTSDDDVERVVQRIADESGRLDCLVNNAGYGQLGPIEDVPIERVHEQFDVNVYGPHRLTRAVLPHMRERGEGTIINVSSTAGRLASPMMGVYAGSKHALEAMSDALRAEVEPFGVDVVLVEPGPVKTPFGERAAALVESLPRSDGYDDLYRIQRDTNVLGGGGGTFGVRPDVVANTIVDAANVSDPAPRYPVGQLAKLGVLGRYLPDRVRDRVFDLVRWVLG